MEQKYKRLFSDTLLFTISNMGSKILIFLLLPLYTSALSSADYGIADLISSTVNLLYPILTLAICDATLRFALGKNVNKHSVLSNSLLLIFIAVAFLLLITPLVRIVGGLIHTYWCFFVATFITVALQTCIANYVKGCNKSKIFAVQGVLYTIVLVISNIVFLLYFKVGLEGYLFAIILANIVSIVYMVVASKSWHDIIKPMIDMKLMKEMLKYSLPMVLTTVTWWINSSADKYMLVGLVGLSANGLYAVAHKIPSIYTTMTSLFSQAWKISAISDYEESDNNSIGKFYSSVYRKYSLLCIYSCAVLTLCSQLLAKIFFRADYFEAWTLVPPLLLASLFEAYSGFLAAIYVAAKDTRLLSSSTCVGVIVNIGLNYFLIRNMGILGAPVATFLSFIVVWSIRTIILKKIITINIDYKRLLFSLSLLVFGAMYFSIDGIRKYAVYICCLMIISVVNFDQTKQLIIFSMNLVKECFSKAVVKKRKD